MEIALAGATMAISRAGASSLAELAAMRVPAILVPYPTATDNHQYFNARALVDVGAAVLLEQKSATAENRRRWCLVRSGTSRLGGRFPTNWCDGIRRMRRS